MSEVPRIGDRSRVEIEVPQELPPRAPTLADVYTLLSRVFSDIGNREKTTERVQRKSSGALMAVAAIGFVAVVASVWLFKDWQHSEEISRTARDKAMSELIKEVKANGNHLIRMQGSQNALWRIVAGDKARPVEVTPDAVTHGTQ